ncbi:MAG: c-type cytochrome biogenesis protein CcsB [Bacteroidales bacterium]|nr:c-type cytochrome biogenesis protein CcsB [Bacteroidales bacterium]
MKILKFFISPLFMGILFIIFAVSMAAATFIENDYGSEAAYGFVYDAWWFELILFLLAVNLTGQMIVHRMFRKSKLPVLIFHLSFLLILAGAGITRYFGWEGTIHIREGEEQVSCFSTDRYINYTLVDSRGIVLSEFSKKYSMITPAEGRFDHKMSTDGESYEIFLSKIIPDAVEVISDDPAGVPMVSLIVAKGNSESEKIFLGKGELKQADSLTIGFESPDEADIMIKSDSGNFFIESRYPIEALSMMTRNSEVLEPGRRVMLRKMQVLTVRNTRLVPQEFTMTGRITVAQEPPQSESDRKFAFMFDIRSGSGLSQAYLMHSESSERSSIRTEAGDKYLDISFGSRERKLPFSLKLNDFILDRYPGSNSPSGYSSDVTLIDRAEEYEKPFKIFMNNVLKYKGYRFYQSSYDSDEKGTILSVNNDPVGMAVTYTGYGFLFAFILLALVSRNSVFRKVSPGYWNSVMRKSTVIFIVLIATVGLVKASPVIENVPDRKGSEELGKILVQDQKGRTKPLFTLSSDIIRKVTRSNRFEQYTPMQVFLGFYFDFEHWKEVPLIRVSSKNVASIIGITGNYASFSDIVELGEKGYYKLADHVDRAYSLAPGKRSKTDKEIIKVDERVNILYMIYNGSFFRILPLKDGSHNWGNPEEALKKAITREDSAFIRDVVPMTAAALYSSNTATVRNIAKSLSEYQKRYAGYELPSESEVKAEMIYYRLNIFERLFPFYATAGLVMLILLIVSVISGRNQFAVVIKITGWILFAGFILHTIGLGLRWYIAGHAPLSNGYESMLFISWVAILAGFIFRNRSQFTLSATAILGSMALLVAHMSFMDPEITNLVPVLKSYWLTLHVSVITSSYGFLGMGAIIGLIVMILLTFSNRKNHERISDTIDQLTVINYKTLTIGLYLLTIGTFLGAIWANESWGRYWGWDPKETWSLITIIVYSFVLHARMMPGLKDLYTFNLLSLFAFSSVLMTYFGVNYYLSGLHSYAGGDPVPVPVFVYLAVIILAGISISGYYKYKKAY